MLKKEGGFPWTEECFRVHHVIQIDGAAIEVVEAVKLIKDINMCTAIVRQVTLFVDTMKVLVSSTSAFKLQYGVEFMDNKKNDIVNGTVSSNVFCQGAARPIKSISALQDCSSTGRTCSV